MKMENGEQFVHFVIRNYHRKKKSFVIIAKKQSAKSIDLDCNTIVPKS